MWYSPPGPLGAGSANSDLSVAPADDVQRRRVVGGAPASAAFEDQHVVGAFRVPEVVAGDGHDRAHAPSTG